MTTLRRLGERAEYIRYQTVRRGGEPVSRPVPLTLGEAVHSDFHWARSRIVAALLAAPEDLYALEETTEGEQLPAGPASFWYQAVAKGKRRPKDLAARFGDIIDRALGARGRRWADWVARVTEAIEGLEAYEPGGELLAETLRLTCVEGRARWERGVGWRHHGREGALALYGSESQWARALRGAWDLVAVRAVDDGVLDAARQAGAVSAEAEAWRR